MNPNALTTIVEDDGEDDEDNDEKAQGGQAKQQQTSTLPTSDGNKAPSLIDIRRVNSPTTTTTTNTVSPAATKRAATVTKTATTTTTTKTTTTKTLKKNTTKPIVMNGEMMSLLSEEMTVSHHPTTSKVTAVVVRGKLEVRAKTFASKDKNVRLACCIHVNKKMPNNAIKFKVNGRHMREKKDKRPRNASSARGGGSAALSSSSSSSSMYQCLVPGHPSKKQAVKILQYVTKEFHSFVHPLQQHLKISPNILLDNRIDTNTNENVTRVAYRIKITKNPAFDWNRFEITKLKIVALFAASKLPQGCKLLCKPKASYAEKKKTLTWNVATVKKTKMKVEAMFTLPSSFKEYEGMPAEQIKPKLMVQFQIGCKNVHENSGEVNDGSTSTSIAIESATIDAVVKGTVRKKLLCKYVF